MAESERILCPVDFSAQSRHALDYAIAMARWHGASVTALYVHPLAVPALAVGPFMGGEAIQPIQLTDAERVHLQQALDGLVEADRAAGASIDALVVQDFDVADLIVARAKDLSATLVVMGTHGRSGLQRWLLGSVAEKVLRAAACPVVTVPPRVADAVPVSEASLRRILCPTDFSDCARSALDRALSLAREARARVALCHVVELLPEVPDMPMPDVGSYRAARLAEGHRRLAELTAQAGGESLVDEHLLHGTAHKEILTLASEEQADLIVMGVSGHGAIDRALLGSTVQRVVRHAPCPVMTIRAT